MNDFVGKICYIPDFQVGVPPNEVQVAWTFKQVRDLEIKTLGCALDENHDPSTDDNSAFIVELILGFEETSKSYGMNVFGEGFSKSIDFVWVAK